MTKQYWVDEFYVDLSRNQISREGLTLTLPPKALSVLTHLAQHAKQVVSYDALLDAVWPNAVVTPNTLQRSIAQLRKAFGEEGQTKEMIKTHAKQGYSLECKVNWQAEQVAPDHEPPTPSSTLQNSEPREPSNAPPNSTSGWNLMRPTSIVLSAVVTAIVLALIFLPGEHAAQQWQVKNISYLTATDDKEFNPKYSADGNYIIFHRYPQKTCANHLWAKDANTQQEFRLTDNLASYTNHSLSADGGSLVFIQEHDCTQPIEQTLCYRLMSIDFQQALKRPQTPKELLQCNHTSIRTPFWLDDNHIALMQQQDEQWRIVRYSVKTSQLSEFYRPEQGNIVSYHFSPALNLFAVTVTKNNGGQYINLLDDQGTLQSSHEIRFPDDMPAQLPVLPRFIPNTELLVFGDGSYLYTLTFDGQVERQDLQLDGNFGGPEFRQDGQKLLLIKGRYDSDIAALSLSAAPASEGLRAIEHHRVFQRSTYHEDLPRYQPGGTLIAFVSERTGREQVWLHDGNHARQISRFEKGAFVQDLRWDTQGTRLLALVNRELRFVGVEGASQRIRLNYPVLKLFNWNSDTQQVIANIRDKGFKRLVQIDLSNGQYRILNNKRVDWAVQTADGQLIYQDHLNRLWKAADVEDILLAPLTNLLGRKQRFVVEDNQIFGVDDKFQLWRYDLETGSLKVLAQLPEDIDYLTDIRGDELLYTYVVAAKKEVIELEIGEMGSHTRD